MKIDTRNSLNPKKEIGGYFGLELPIGQNFPHNNGLLLNTGRNCLEYILKFNNAARLFIPRYTCDVVLEPLKKLNISFVYYRIGLDFQILENFSLKKTEYLLYTNYFGINDTYIKKVRKIYPYSLIVDNSQSFYSPPLKNVNTFYSPRKYFGLSDGGIVYSRSHIKNKLIRDFSTDRSKYLLKRLDTSGAEGYEHFKHSDHDLINQPIKRMSLLTEHILRSINFSAVKEKRIHNFYTLHKSLHHLNELKIPEHYFCPMLYPFLIKNGYKIRKTLIKKRVYIATYWPDVLEFCDINSNEHYLSKNLLALPIDQRYDTQEMMKIVNIIKQCNFN